MCIWKNRIAIKESDRQNKGSTDQCKIALSFKNVAKTDWTGLPHVASTISALHD